MHSGLEAAEAPTVSDTVLETKGIIMNARTLDHHLITTSCLFAMAAAACIADQPLGQATQASQSANSQSANSQSANALSANETNRDFMLDEPLATSAYHKDSPTANGALVTALRDPYAQEFFSYLVSCALDAAETVHWSHPDPQNAGDEALDVVAQGALGLCPEWASGSVANNAACQEKVSACLLARVNAFGEMVPLSLISDRAGLFAGTSVRGYENPDSDSGAPCSIGESGSLRECGWNMGYVGVCTQQGNTELQLAHGECDADEKLSMRVCDGLLDCKSEDALVTVEDACEAPTVIPCTPGRAFTVMTAFHDGDGPVSAFVKNAAGTSIYPAPESVVFSFPEAGFFGNMFTGTPAITVQVNGAGQVQYEYDVPGTPATEIVVITGDRTAGHVFAMNSLSVSGGSIYPDTYACAHEDFLWADALLHKRICGLYGNKEFCSATPLGTCYEQAPTDICATDDDPMLAGSGDVTDCTGGNQTWSHVVTTYLNDPCDLAGNDPSVCAQNP